MVCFVLVGMANAFGQYGDDGCIPITNPLEKYIKERISNESLGLSDSRNKSSSPIQNPTVITKYLEDFVKGINSSKRGNNRLTTNSKGINLVMKKAESDLKYKIVMGGVSNKTTYNEFMSNLEANKSKILKQKDGAEFYVALHYSMQILKGKYQELGSSKTQNLVEDTVLTSMFEELGCGGAVFRTMVSGAVVGGLVTGGNPVGIGVGLIAGGLISGASDCLGWF